MDASLINLTYAESYYSQYSHNKEPYHDNKAVIYVLDKLADYLMRHTRFETHLDVGCAMGHLVASLRRRNKESYGIDASEYAIENTVVPARRFVRCADARTLLDEGKSYDLVTCVEVVEHLPLSDECLILDTLCGLSDVVYFSSADDHNDPTHLNPHPAAYWRERFLERGFVPIREVFYYIPWGFLFVKAETYSQLKKLLDDETRVTVLTRDDFKCILCDRKGVQVHEIIPRSAFGKKTMHKCYETKNRVCLCPDCHEKAHTVATRKQLLSLMATKFGYEYTEQFYQGYLETEL